MPLPSTKCCAGLKHIHTCPLPERRTSCRVVSAPDPNHPSADRSPRVILDAIRAGVGLGLGPRLPAEVWLHGHLDPSHILFKFWAHSTTFLDACAQNCTFSFRTQDMNVECQSYKRTSSSSNIPGYSHSIYKNGVQQRVWRQLTSLAVKNSQCCHPNIALAPDTWYEQSYICPFPFQKTKVEECVDNKFAPGLT